MEVRADIGKLANREQQIEGARRSSKGRGIMMSRVQAYIGATITDIWRNLNMPVSALPRWAGNEADTRRRSRQ